MHVAHCAATTTGRAGPRSSESMTPCGTLFFCSFLSSAHQTIPGRPEISQGERTPPTHDLQTPPDRIKSPIRSSPSPNCRITAASWAHGRPVRPHQGYHHQGCPLTDRGRVTGVTMSRVPVDRCACFQDKIGLVAGWPGPPLQHSTLNLHLQPPGAVEPVMHFTLLTAAVDLRKIGIVAS